jgi:hypothetical protein
MTNLTIGYPTAVVSSSRGLSRLLLTDCCLHWINILPSLSIGLERAPREALLEVFV